MWQKGFTLVETMTVLVLAAILLGLAIPRINAFYEIKLSSAARRLVSDIKYARYLSLIRFNNDTYGIEFNTIKDNYRIYKVSDPTAYVKTTSGLSDYCVDFVLNPAYQGVNLVSANFDGTNRLQFTSKGIPQDGNAKNLNFISSIVISYHGHNSTIKIAPLTGQVTLK